MNLARRHRQSRHETRSVFLKEVRENLRDRRTVINTLVTGPLFAPLIFVLLINTLVTRELDKAEKPLPLPVIGAENAPNLIEALKQQRVEIKPAPADAERAVREQDADVVLRIPKDFASARGTRASRRRSRSSTTDRSATRTAPSAACAACSSTTTSAPARCAWSRAGCRRR